MEHVDNLEYVLKNLYLARAEVIAHPEWYEPDALDRIDRAITAVQGTRPQAIAA
jgi:hypothetical protein